VNGRLAAGAQLSQQPLLGGLPVQVGDMLGGDLVTGDGVHGAVSLWIATRRSGGSAVGPFTLVTVLGAPGGGTSVQRTDIGTDGVWVVPME
jgi:hypothetical protein